MTIFSFTGTELTRNALVTTRHAVVLSYQYTFVTVECSGRAKLARHLVRISLVLVFASRTNDTGRCGTGVLISFGALLATRDHDVVDIVLSIVDQVTTPWAIVTLDAWVKMCGRCVGILTRVANGTMERGQRNKHTSLRTRGAISVSGPRV